MAIRSVHPKSLKDGGSEGYFLQQPHYSCEKKTAAEKYGKVQLLTCLSHTQILSSKSITTTARPKLLLRPHDWEKFTNFLVVPPQGTHRPISLPLPLWSRPRPTNKLTLPAPGRPHRRARRESDQFPPSLSNVLFTDSVDSVVLPPPRVSYPPPQPHTSRFSPGKERGQRGSWPLR